MAAPTTTDSFLELVAKSNLIPPARLEAVLRQTKPGHLETPRQAAGVLLAVGLLTQFQAQQLLQGKHKGFAIGKYKVLERLGYGGSGTIYLCEHTLMRRRVAIKVLPSSRAANPALLMRFYREARASGLLDHPNLVRCHDIDCDGNLHFLVMDYVDGASLQEIVARTGPLSVLRACHYIRDAAIALGHAHQHGLIHRDVKPANIMVDRSGTVKLLDLGLARFFHDETDPLTVKFDDQGVLGTADYVSPEQIVDSHHVDIRTDIYSLGATFYFALTGGPLFPEGKPTEKLLWHQVRKPTPVQQLRREVPDALARIVATMLAKTPDERYQSPAEVADLLEPWTREPIAPPEESELPELSLAARQAGATPGAARNRDTPSWHDQTPRRAIQFTMQDIAEMEMQEEQQATAHRPTPSAPDIDATPVPVARTRRRPARETPPPPKRSIHPGWIVLLLTLAAALGILARFASVWLGRVSP